MGNLITGGIGLGGNLIVTGGLGIADASIPIPERVEVIPLITQPAGFETVVDQIAEVLAFECAAQQVQATAAGFDPTEWAFKVYKERNTPWDQYLSCTDKTPMVNIWYDSATPDKSRSDHSIEQVHEGRFNVDCYAYATATQTDDGHTPGDEASAASAHKIARIVIGILMHWKYRYLGDGDVICDRWLSSINSMKPPSDNAAVQRITGVRLTFDIDYLQSAVFGPEETIELVNINYHHEADGQTVAALRYEV